MKNSDDIRKRLRKTIAAVFELDEQHLPEDPSPQTIERWDSLGHLQLIIAVEQEFNVHFTMEKIPQLTSLELITSEVLHATR